MIILLNNFKNMNYLKIVISILICQSAGVIGSIFTSKSVNSWYKQLNTPSFNPPSWLFGPVWLILYSMMGFSLYMVYEKGFEKREVKVAVIFFIVHLVVNALWSFIFFGLRNPGAAFACIIILLAMIIISIILFFKVDKTASYLLIPYLLWVSFASVLNYSIWKLN